MFNFGAFAGGLERLEHQPPTSSNEGDKPGRGDGHV